jgi:HK97 family phage prohead protease
MQRTIRRVAQPQAVKFAGEQLGERQVEAILSSGAVDRAGDIVVQRGIDYSAFMRAGGPVLWQHDSDFPIARTLRMGIEAGCLTATVQFPPTGTSEQSDEAYRLIKADVVTGVSIGFLPRSWEFIDTPKPGSGVRFLEIELLEFSFVSVPANSQALIIGKAWRGGADLPAADSPLDPVRQPWAGCDRLRAEERQRRRFAIECRIEGLRLTADTTTVAGRRAYAERLAQLSQLAEAWR